MLRIPVVSSRLLQYRVRGDHNKRRGNRFASSKELLMQRRSLLKLAGALPALTVAQSSRTEVSIRADQFFLNGVPTYQGRTYEGMKIEGLLMNVRAVQAAFDDLNPATRSRWAYPDTGKWDPERNTREFLEAL